MEATVPYPSPIQCRSHESGMHLQRRDQAARFRPRRSSLHSARQMLCRIHSAQHRNTAVDDRILVVYSLRLLVTRASLSVMRACRRIVGEWAQGSHARASASSTCHSRPTNRLWLTTRQVLLVTDWTVFTGLHCFAFFVLCNVSACCSQDTSSVTTLRGVLYCITHMKPHWFMLEIVESLLDASDEDDEQRSD